MKRDKYSDFEDLMVSFERDTKRLLIGLCTFVVLTVTSFWVILHNAPGS